MNDDTESIKKILDENGIAIGDEHRKYSLPERVQNLITAKDYFAKQTETLRTAIARAEGRTD